MKLAQFGKYVVINEVLAGHIWIVGDRPGNHPKPRARNLSRSPDDDGRLPGVDRSDQTICADFNHLLIVRLVMHLVGHIFSLAVTEVCRHQKLLLSRSDPGQPA